MPEIFSSERLVQGPEEKVEIPSEYVGGLRIAIHHGKASFGDKLKDLVALSYGANEEGLLDLNRFEAAVKTNEYLSSHAGLPFAIVDILHMDGELVRIDAVAGVLASEFDSNGTRVSDRKGEIFDYGTDYFNAGIAIEGKASAVEWEKWPDGILRLRNSVANAEGVLPFNFPGLHTSLGKQHRGQLDDSATSVQHVVAGWDILPWIAETFDEADRYDIFLGLLNAIRDAGTGAEIYLDDEKYLRQLARERRVLTLAQSALMKANKAMEEEAPGAFIRSTFNLRAAVVKHNAGTLAARHGLQMLDELLSVAPGSIDGRLRRVDIDLTHDYHPGVLVLPQVRLR